jgi:hypothetical protein
LITAQLKSVQQGSFSSKVLSPGPLAGYVFGSTERNASSNPAYATMLQSKARLQANVTTAAAHIRVGTMRRLIVCATRCRNALPLGLSPFVFTSHPSSIEVQPLLLAALLAEANYSRTWICLFFNRCTRSPNVSNHASPTPGLRHRHGSCPNQAIERNWSPLLRLHTPCLYNQDETPMPVPRDI